MIFAESKAHRANRRRERGHPHHRSETESGQIQDGVTPQRERERRQNTKEVRAAGKSMNRAHRKRRPGVTVAMHVCTLHPCTLHLEP